MRKKICSKCQQDKPIKEFNKNGCNRDGLSYWCKNCQREYHKIYRESESYQHHLPAYRLYQKGYWRSERGRQVKREHAAYYRANNQEKVIAQHITYHAIISGKLQRQFCGVCGSSQTHAHHSDYSQPLKVQWLCPIHHQKIHKEDDSLGY